MPYIGNELATQFQAFVTQTITGDGSTGYTLDRAVANGKELLVYINNVKQEEGSGKAYTASGTTITFSEAVASGDSCYLVYLGSAVQTVAPPDASVGSSTLRNANLEMPNTLDMNGKELILDADGDTSIEASTDDTIVFDTGGSEAMRITADRDVLIAKTSEGTGTAGFEVQSNGKVFMTADGAKCLELNRLTDVGDIFKASTGGNQRIALGGSGGAGYIDGAVGDAGLKFEGAHVRPRDNGSDVDDGITLGNGSFRFSSIFATSGSVSTSDETEKQNIATLSSKELNAAKKLSTLFKTFKWKSAVEKKADKARIHTGIIAQEVQKVLQDEGLDASNYAFWCSDTWWEKNNEVYDTKEEAPDGATERTRLGVRYNELLAFIGASTEQRLASMEARLTALESK